MFGYPEQYVELIEDMYKDSKFKVKCKSGYTELIERFRGIIQGDPISMDVFEQCVDIWIRWVINNIEQPSIPNPVQGYVDDVGMSTNNKQQLYIMCEKTTKFVELTGMNVKHSKCGLFTWSPDWKQLES